RIPSDFVLGMTEISPLQPSGFKVNPGDPVTITVGNDTIFTGYVDRYSMSIDPGSHDVRITGRSKVQDLVDCNVVWIEGYQTAGGTIVDLAKQVISPQFGISVIDKTSGGLPQLPPFQPMLTDTPWSILDRAARFSKCLLYDDENGNL